MNVLWASYLGRMFTGHFVKVYRKTYHLQISCFGEMFYLKLTSNEAEP